MKHLILKLFRISPLFILLFSLDLSAQHAVQTDAALDTKAHTLDVRQKLAYRNQTNDTLYSLILNDWNNAYSGKETELAKRFSDEFVRSYHLSKKEERGHTDIHSITTNDGTPVTWERYKGQSDLVEIHLSKPLQPGGEIVLDLLYLAKLPSDKFTHFGFGANLEFNLRDCLLTPARYADHDFVRYHNKGLDDCANAATDYNLKLSLDTPLSITTDLDVVNSAKQETAVLYELSGKNRMNFSLYLNWRKDVEVYKNKIAEVSTDISSKNITAVQKALIIDRITQFVAGNIGAYPYEKITVSQADYERNPFYGLNQLPSFLSPFDNEFIYEIKFLKIYVSNFLKNSLKLDPRKDAWIYDGMQIYAMMQYMDTYYPDAKMMGKVSKMKLLKNYTITQLPFNEQYSYFYMLMARKNLDQPLGDPKDALIKFNEQIASKYRAGISFRYLASYEGEEKVKSAINDFYAQNTSSHFSERQRFESLLKSKTDKNIDWFFDTMIDTRKIVDYKFTDAAKKGDSITFTVRNKTGATVPIPVYGMNGKNIVFREWLENVKTDSTFTILSPETKRLVLNYENDVPEYNMRNNWRSLKGFRIGDRPVKFTFFRDLEDPYYNQVLFLPTVVFNVYDGVSPGMRFHNKTILDKPFMFDITPIYSIKTKSLIGSFSGTVNQNLRDSRLYNIRYQFSGSFYHYAPDATYTKLNPSVWMRFRPKDFRDNQTQLLLLRNVFVERQASLLVPPDDKTVNYNVFNARYVNSRTETTHHMSLTSDLQFSSQFGKASVEMGFRRLFNDNRQINLRLYAGTFLYRKTDSDYFSFALDRPTDYLFDYEYYGRSEQTGLFSQQIIIAEGGFKSKLDTPFANQWIATSNLSFNVWNWIEVYGDLGMVKNQLSSPKFVYDSGIRLNLVTDYFELYFPVYSNNGWEIAQQEYSRNIRFIVTLNPKVLLSLFTRKWF